jgi:nucleoside-diphosphate-sugar epimerase
VKIAITGATGGVGRHTVKSALGRGDSVRALVRDPSRADDLARQGVELVRGDLFDAVALQSLTDGVDAVIHRAGHVGDQGGDLATFERVNVGGTKNVLEAAARKGVKRFVHVSSVAYYGRPQQGIIDERFEPLPNDAPYEASKLAAERIVFGRGRELGIGVAAVRPPVIYGPYDRQFLPRLVDRLRHGRLLYVDGGQAPFNIVSSADVADVLLRCTNHPAAAGEAFNVAASPPPTFKAMVETIAHAAGLKKPRLSLRKKPALGLARLIEGAWKLARAKGPAPLTRFVVEVISLHIVYDAAKARDVLGWDGGRAPLEDLTALTRDLVTRGG